MSHPTPEEREMLADIAAECGLARDYRKEAWIAAGVAAMTWPDNRACLTPEQAAAAFLVSFDQAFPS